MLFNRRLSLAALYKRLGRFFQTTRRANRRHCWSGPLECLESRQLPAVITVTSAADGILDDNQVTLREALYAAENDISVDGSAMGQGADTIRFSESLKSQTIQVSYSFYITTDVTITGLGSNDLTIDGMNASNLFYVETTASGVISGLSLTIGWSMKGGAINNLGTLTLSDCVIAGNQATQLGGTGGGIANLGNLTLVNSVVSQNFCQAGGGGIDNEGVVVLVARETERCRSGDRESVEVGGVDGVCEVGFLRHGQKV